MSTVKYACKGCGVRSVVIEGQIIRPCTCDAQVGVTADLSATATGEADVCSAPKKVVSEANVASE